MPPIIHSVFVELLTVVSGDHDDCAVQKLAGSQVIEYSADLVINQMQSRFVVVLDEFGIKILVKCKFVDRIPIGLELYWIIVRDGVIVGSVIKKEPEKRIVRLVFGACKR
jgi:hypothetical protein